MIGHGGLIQNADRHFLSPRISIEKKIIQVLSCITIDSLFAKAIAFEVLGMCSYFTFLTRMIFSFSDARSISRNGQQCLVRIAEIEKLTDNASIVDGTSKKIFLVGRNEDNSCLNGIVYTAGAA